MHSITIDGIHGVSTDHCGRLNFTTGAQVAVVLNHVLGELEPASFCTDVAFAIRAQCAPAFEAAPLPIRSQSDESNDRNQPHELTAQHMMGTQGRLQLATHRKIK